MTSKHQVHNTQDDDRLLRQFVQTRDAELREQLILRFLPLVHYSVGRLGIMRNGHFSYDDLVNQGVLGLIESVDRYDPSYGAQFSTFAITKIRGNILDYMRGQDWLPRTARRRAKQVQEATQNLWNKLHRSPTDEEIAEVLNLPVDKVRQALTDASFVFISLDSFRLFDQEDQVSIHEAIPDDDTPTPMESIEEMDRLSLLETALGNLSDRSRLILSLYYYEELTLKEIGAVLEISESRVCQLHAKAILDLKAMMKEQRETTQQEFASHV